MRSIFIYFFFSFIAFVSAAFFGLVIVHGEFHGTYAGLLVFLVIMSALLITMGMRLFVDGVHAYVSKDIIEYE